MIAHLVLLFACLLMEFCCELVHCEWSGTRVAHVSTFITWEGNVPSHFCVFEKIHHFFKCPNLD